MKTEFTASPKYDTRKDNWLDLAANALAHSYTQRISTSSSKLCVIVAVVAIMRLAEKAQW